MRSDIVDIYVHIHAKTDRAILASTDGEKGNAAWLPLSQIEVEMRGRQEAIVSLPAWLAEAKNMSAGGDAREFDVIERMERKK